MKKKSSIGKDQKTLIASLLTDVKTCFWPVEMRMAKCLLKMNPDMDFWIFLSKRQKFVSLKSLLAQKNIIFSTQIEYEKHKLELNNGACPPIEKKKIGDDFILDNRPKTLLDFINK